MLFNSYQFVFFFSLVILSIYFSGVVSRFKNFKILILISFSLFFYAYDSYKFLFLLLFSILFNYFISIQIDNINSKRLKKLALFFIIIFNILILLYFKYFNFFIENLSILFSESNISYIKVYLPLAISFFTFQQISYQIDNFKVYQKKI